MALVINSNVSSLMAQRHLEGSRKEMETSMERLASGKRINMAGDDAAGLGIRDRMTAQIESLNQSVRNANDSVSMAQVAEGAMEEVNTILTRIRQLSIQAANSTYSANDRISLNAEVTLLVAEITRISSDTEFNGVKIMDGSFIDQTTMIGTASSHTTKLSINSLASSSLGVGSNSSYAASLTSAVVTGSLSTGDVTINGYQIPATVADGVSSSGDTASGIAVTKAINIMATSTNVTAKVNSTSLTGTAVTLATTAIVAGDIKINGVSIGAIVASSDAGERGGTVAAAVNAITPQTGVTATFNSSTGAVALTAKDGRNITISSLITAGASTISGITMSNATSAGATATSTTRSTVSLSGSGNGGISIGGAAEASAGLTAGTTAATVTVGAGVSSLDLTTQAGALAALNIVDAAVNEVALERGKLGAFTNRLQHTVSNMMATSEKTASARSGIEDADFAKESATLAKAQVLQQAGTAMLAQANASTQDVLTLLK
jgi:flagellin